MKLKEKSAKFWMESDIIQVGEEQCSFYGDVHGNIAIDDVVEVWQDGKMIGAVTVDDICIFPKDWKKGRYAASAETGQDIFLISFDCPRQLHTDQKALLFISKEN